MLDLVMSHNIKGTNRARHWSIQCCVIMCNSTNSEMVSSFYKSRQYVFIDIFVTYSYPPQVSAQVNVGAGCSSLT